MPLRVEGVRILRAIPSSPLEQISAPSALFCLWRSQPGAFVPSGKAVLHLSPIGRQAPRGSREGCALSAVLQKALTAAAQGFFPSSSLFLWMRHFPRSQLTPKVRLCCGLCGKGSEGAGKGPSLHRSLPKGPTSSAKPLGEISRGRRRHGAAMGLPDLGTAPWVCSFLCTHEVSPH